MPCQSEGRVMARVLVVDDDDAIRETVGMVLEDAGYEVIEAEDGAAGLHILRSSAAPLIVLLDFRMPRMSGGEVIRVVTEEGLDSPHVYALVLATPHLVDSDPALQARVRKLAIPVVAKPFSIDKLLDVVASLAARLDAVLDA